jgi:hypothetical protein
VWVNNGVATIRFCFFIQVLMCPTFSEPRLHSMVMVDGDGDGDSARAALPQERGVRWRTCGGRHRGALCFLIVGKNFAEDVIQDRIVFIVPFFDRLLFACGLLACLRA